MRITGMTNDTSRTKTYFVALFLLAVIALIYATPWDNFLVANSIWYYDTNQVLGIIIGYVPVEEYTFFVLQTFLVGIFTITIFSKKLAFNQAVKRERKTSRFLSSILLFLLWMISFFTYISRIESLIYLNLILIWALPPITLQLLYGADILWEKKLPLFLIIIMTTTYLSIADAMAISVGIWTITRSTSTGILIGGILPIEEILFFLVTNILIIFGLTLIINQNSQLRFRGYLRLFDKFNGIITKEMS
jgi:lycopene cyclase domain-containing protein